MSNRILFLGEVEFANSYVEELRSKHKHDLMIVLPRSRQDFLRKLKEGEFGECAGVVLSWAFKLACGRFDTQVIDLFGPSLKIISSTGAGYDAVDVEHATKRGIWVSNTPGVGDDATADIAMLLILSTTRDIYEAQQSLRQGNWKGDLPLGIDSRRLKLGILGLGGIGKALAQRAHAFGMELYYHNRNPVPNEVANAYHISYLPFDDLLNTVDVLSIHVPLSSVTTKLIGAKEFAKMKDGSILINTARGPVVDEDALVEALDSGKLKSAGLDVYQNEPEIHPGLLRNTKVQLLPHIGSCTKGTFENIELLALENCHLTIVQGKPRTPVNDLMLP
ncbi:glyoxylate/hydroxypyruvate reductase [Basidiobolus meristosporus CBS 931.73]|uniref:Glyoxylate/hydroxypyruvate reductase n=1 Tax=Basidiobolus meristosporus CBS 931.73 TaxID=1314790 RepID=A0A1Y1Z3J5_9FUNG|nr:glyoxylate/hydroxypyruvate reductase [Basidiobolus meristosporus CBS 931.73]|eukprot:ORY04851.1 glyoxylate/hydroxypyruvate reductase [Basidiobolus meristosporus CBS 931.73]